LCSLRDKVVKAKLLLGSLQGGILSPTCGWNCAMTELLERLEKSPDKCKAFADDLAIIVRGRNLKKVLQHAQRAMNIAADWASIIGVEFSTSKTMTMLFTRKRKKSYQSPGRLRLEGQSLPWVKEAKYLGVTIDDKLTWQTHITAKIKKAKKTLMAAKSSISKSWGPDCVQTVLDGYGQGWYGQDYCRVQLFGQGQLQARV
jgi:hypothetical protein